MKFSLYIAGLAFIIVSCSTTRNFSSIMEDDIYYVPGKKALAIREVEILPDMISGPNNRSIRLS